MSRSRGRHRSNQRRSNERPHELQLHAGRVLAITESIAIFECMFCDEVHIHHMEPGLREALDHENEEGPPQETATLHDHSLGVATESKYHDI